MKHAFFITVLSLSVCVLYAKKFPSFVQKCKRDDPGLSNCLKNSILKFRKYLPEGVRALRIPPMDPYTMERATLTTSWMNATLTDIKLHNAFDYDVDYFKIDLISNTIWLNLTQKYMEMKCHYEVNGQLFQVDLYGGGEAVVNFTDTKSTSVIHGTRIQKKGKEYLNLESIDFKLLDNSLEYFYLHDLFRDNPELTDRLHRLMNENLNELSVEVIPVSETIISKIVLSFFKAVFDSHPLSDLFI